jgi:hypothetical protein
VSFLTPLTQHPIRCRRFYVSFSSCCKSVERKSLAFIHTNSPKLSSSLATRPRGLSAAPSFQLSNSRKPSTSDVCSQHHRTRPVPAGPDFPRRSRCGGRQRRFHDVHGPGRGGEEERSPHYAGAHPRREEGLRAAQLCLQGPVDCDPQLWTCR